MLIDEFRDYCRSKKRVSECMPFDQHTLVFKVGSKMFALASLNEIPLRVNLKCMPDRALELREEYPEIVLPGYHMNKTHWNTLIMEGGMPRNWYYELIDHSYELVVNSITRKQQKELD
ncbi:MAG TPA: MmcQ-like protein [Flavobacteriaceae bacterium]|nr:MmcQ-like protein [Flavobacteriaceae bacterium]